MNTVLADYKNISNVELNTRIAYYDQLSFSNETIVLLIPDVDAYVKKIFNCLRWAKENRLIIEDISKQMISYRVSNKSYVSSVAYKVGSLNLDGRAYIQKNVHQYCQYIAEINDCLLQILNIVFNAGFRPWDTFRAEDIYECEKFKSHKHLYRLCNKFYSTIKLHKEFDNFNKHNLVLWGRESFSADILNELEYNFYMHGQKHKMSEFINESIERTIKISVIELLDNIFSCVDFNNHIDRKYVNLLFDFCAAKNSDASCTENKISSSSQIAINITSKTDGKYRVADSCSYTHDNTTIPDKLFLARFYYETINNVTQVKLEILDCNEFDVFQNHQKVGRYICNGKEDKNANYFHFKEFIFVRD